jgi:hypothetical protein
MSDTTSVAHVSVLFPTMQSNGEPTPSTAQSSGARGHDVLIPSGGPRADIELE